MFTFNLLRVVLSKHTFHIRKIKENFISNKTGIHWIAQQCNEWVYLLQVAEITLKILWHDLIEAGEKVFLASIHEYSNFCGIKQSLHQKSVYQAK